MKQLHPYAGKTAYLATQHGKGALIAPAFQSILDMDVVEVAVNTDQLGTFAGEVERVGTPREVALKKAHLAISATTSPYGLASEGSIGVDPLIPFINSDIELIAFVDKTLGIEVVESIRSTEIVAASVRVDKNTDLQEFLSKADFPRHRIIVRSLDIPVSFAVKGIATAAELDNALTQGFANFESLVVESDLRAHCSPSRQANIASVAQKLATRLAALCPECSTPGWGVQGFTKGLPCSECGEISHEALKSEILGCAKCSYKADGKVLAVAIDPSQCNVCNP